MLDCRADGRAHRLDPGDALGLRPAQGLLPVDASGDHAHARGTHFVPNTCRCSQRSCRNFRVAGTQSIKWLVTSLSPGNGPSLLKRLHDLRRQARDRVGREFPLITIQEAGLDGFWLPRVLLSEGIESHVVGPASVAVSRRRRRAKTDRIDDKALVRNLLAYKRGEPRVCAMVIAPSPDDEDARRLVRESRNRQDQPCCSPLRESVMRLQRFFGQKACHVTSTIADRSLPMPNWHQLLGRAIRSTASRAFPRLEIHG